MGLALFIPDYFLAERLSWHRKIDDCVYSRVYFLYREVSWASFFFSKGGGDVSHAGKFFPSVAVQLTWSDS